MGEWYRLFQCEKRRAKQLCSLGIFQWPLSLNRKQNTDMSTWWLFIDHNSRDLSLKKTHSGSKTILISYLLRFSDRIDGMKNSYGNFFTQSQSRIDFLTRGKSRFIQSEISCQNESVSSQTRSRCFWRLFNLHSQTFVEFPRVYSSFVGNLPQTKFEQIYRFR